MMKKEKNENIERGFLMKSINVIGNQDLINYFKKDPNILLAAVFGSFVENDFLEKIRKNQRYRHSHIV
jgi:hypothetical protein